MIINYFQTHIVSLKNKKILTGQKLLRDLELTLIITNEKVRAKKNASRSWRQVIEAGFIQARNLSSSIKLYKQITFVGQVKSLIFMKIC